MTLFCRSRSIEVAPLISNWLTRYRAPSEMWKTMCTRSGPSYINSRVDADVLKPEGAVVLFERGHVEIDHARVVVAADAEQRARGLRLHAQPFAADEGIAFE